MTAPPTPYGPPPSVPLHEVEWRIDGRPIVKEGQEPRARYVPYIDARWLAAGLDEWVGPQNWRRDFHHVTFRGLECVTCDVEIWFPPSEDGTEGRWVGKPDIGLIEGGGQTGTKGTYSDAFKRSACVAWGVGRNVYELPGDIYAQCKIKANPKAKGDYDKWQAYPHPAAVLQIRQELEKRGHEILHITAEPKVGTMSADTDGTAEDADTIDKAQIEALKEQFAGLTPETKKTAQAEFFREWGKASDIAAKNYEAALEAAYRIATSHGEAQATKPSAAEGPTPPAQEATAPDVTTVEDVAADPAGPTDPPPSAPAESPIGLTPEEIDQMTLKGITEHLNQFDLPITGNMATKKARLKAHIAPFTQSPDAPKAPQGPTGTMDDWLAGAELPAHPETGETLSTLENYVTGIEKYEESFEDAEAMLWNEWLSATFPDDVWPPTIQHKAYVAWTTAHHLQTHGELP